MSAEPAAPRRCATHGIWTLPDVRPSTMPTPPDLIARRGAVEAAARPVAAPGVEIAEVCYGGVRCISCEPPDARDVLVHLHGGGYRLGSAAQFTPFATRLAAATGARVVTVDYRLAPEHPFPAAVHDAANVYHELVAESGRPPVVIGESAGGGLAAALVLACARAPVAVPRALVLLSPWLDLRCVAGSYRSRASTDRLFSHDAARQAAEQYLQGHDPGDPLASPLLGDVASFPPTLLFASADEVLLDDTVTMASSLSRAGVPTVTCVERGVPHTWPSVDPGRPESAAALEVIARFIATRAV